MSDREFYIQQLMDEAYASYGPDIKFEDWQAGLDKLHKQAVLVGNTNYQIGNGGWSQLKGNYMPGDWCNGTWTNDQYEIFTKLMVAIGTPACLRVNDMWDQVYNAHLEEEVIDNSYEIWDEEAQDYITEEDTETESYWTYGGRTIDMEALDDEFYTFSDQWLKEVDTYLKTGKVKALWQPEPALADSKPPMSKPVLKLSGVDGNAFMLLGTAHKVAKQNGMDFTPIREEAMSGDYDHLLQTLMTHFDVR